jgi:hypothetical protein
MFGVRATVTQNAIAVRGSRCDMLQVVLDHIPGDSVLIDGAF